jgi:hypothetical protein
MFCHGCDGDHEVIGRPRHDGGEARIHRSIATNSSAEGDGPSDLIVLRQDGLVLSVLSLFGLRWGRGKSCKVSVNF